MSLQEIVLIILALLMGTTFSLVKVALHYLAPEVIVEFRYILAACFSLILSYKYLPKLSRFDFIAGLSTGILIFLGHLLHTIGLKSISTSQSAFIMAFYVPIVPFLQSFLTRRTPHPLTWLSVFIAFAGLLILVTPHLNELHWGRGEIITFLSALTLALSLVLTGRFAPSMNKIENVATIQLTSCALLAILCHQSTSSQPTFLISPAWVIPIVILAFISAFKQFVVNWTQKKVSPTYVTLIISIEPVFASLIGWLRGETITPRMLLGGLIILIAVTLTSLSSRHTKTP